MFCIIIIIILLIIAYKVHGVDSIDRTHPFGTDKYKNKKYAKGLVGEDYGVGTYWGKPSKKDDVLDKMLKYGKESLTENDKLLLEDKEMISPIDEI